MSDFKIGSIYTHQVTEYRAGEVRAYNSGDSFELSATLTENANGELDRVYEAMGSSHESACGTCMVRISKLIEGTWTLLPNMTAKVEANTTQDDRGNITALSFNVSGTFPVGGLMCIEILVQDDHQIKVMEINKLDLEGYPTRIK